MSSRSFGDLGAPRSPPPLVISLQHCCPAQPVTLTASGLGCCCGFVFISVKLSDALQAAVLGCA